MPCLVCRSQRHLCQTRGCSTCTHQTQTGATRPTVGWLSTSGLTAAPYHSTVLAQSMRTSGECQLSSAPRMWHCSATHQHHITSNQCCRQHRAVMFNLESKAVEGVHMWYWCCTYWHCCRHADATAAESQFCPQQPNTCYVPDILLCLQGRGWQLDRQQDLNSSGCLYCASLC